MKEQLTFVTLIAQYARHGAPSKPDWDGRKEFLRIIFDDVSGNLNAKLGEFGLDVDDMTLKITVPKVESHALRERLENNGMIVIRDGARTYTGIYHSAAHIPS